VLAVSEPPTGPRPPWTVACALVSDAALP
jgi:hypothetical protein